MGARIGRGAGGEDRHARAGIGGDALQLGPGGAGVDQQRPGVEPAAGEQEGRQRHRVLGGDQHPVAGADVAGAQRLGGDVGGVKKLAPGHVAAVVIARHAGRGAGRGIRL
jgi:hypothetical protein